jgi:hypothetical protein
MNRLLSIGALALTAFTGTAAYATNYYVSDCQAGASAGCVAGNDANAGTSQSAPWKSTTKVASQFPNLAPGDQILFARGGSWADASLARMQNLRATAASPITLDAYTPSSGSTARPILTEARAGTDMLSFDNSGTAVPDGGYVVKNLDLRGNGTGQYGIFTSGATSDVTINNVNIQGFEIGMYCGENIQRVKLQNSTLTNNGSFGTLWGCINSVIEGNTFDHNGYVSTTGRDHTIYLGNSTPTAANVVVRNNRLLNNSVPMSGGVCGGVPLVVHGMWSGLTIEGNLIYQAPNTSTNGCWGIAVDGGYDYAEIFANLVIRGNSIVNVGGVGIGCSSCVAPLIENNVIVMQGGPDLAGIQIPDRERGSGDAADTGAIIRNNSIYFGTVPGYGTGISVATLGTGSSAGSKIQVSSNLIFFAGGSGSTSRQCFDTTGTTTANFTAFDYNLCFDATGAARYSAAYATMTAARSAGFDVHGIAANPLLAAAPSSANNWSMALSATSPAINTGSPTGSSTLDVLSVLRSTPDIGAFEFGGVTADKVPPSPPANVTIQ